MDKNLLLELEHYIESHIEILVFNSVKLHSLQDYCLPEEIRSSEMIDFIETNRQPSFQSLLFQYIDAKGAADAEIYKKAGIDRRHFSKIRSNKEYRPSKPTVIALAMALTLSKKNAEKLLSAAGYSLSTSETYDLVILFCLEKKIYDMVEVNAALDHFSLKPLIGVTL